MKKILITMIFLILLLLQGLTTVLSVENESKIIYVDDDNKKGPWDGTPEHPYRYIQNAIDNANPGDLIRVYSGAYDDSNNNLYITKTLSIIGNGSSITFIEPQIYIEADNVLLRGFNVNGFDYKTLKHVCCIKLKSSNYCNINNNTIATDLSGIQFYDSNFNYIENDVFSKSESNKPVIYLFSSNNNIIRSNYVYTHDFGIYLDHCQNNTIDNNNFESIYTSIVTYSIYLLYSINNSVISNNFSNCNTPFCLRSSDYNTIENNMMKNSGSMKIYSSNNNILSRNNMSEMYYGFSLKNSCNNIIDENIYRDSKWPGIGISDGSNNNMVSCNSIVDNIIGGILISNSNNNIIKLNNMSNNKEGGVYINPEANNNTICQNNIQNNGNMTDQTGGGIVFEGESNGNNIYSNNIIKNTDGIQLCGNNNIIKNNNFIRNKRHATFSSSRRNIWYSNYWDNLVGFGPKLIFGKINIGPIEIISVNFDWHPAKKPYNIGVQK